MELLPLGRRLTIEIIIDELISASISDITLLLGPEHDGVLEHIVRVLNGTAHERGGRVTGAVLPDGTLLHHIPVPERVTLGEALLRAEPILENNSFLLAQSEVLFASTNGTPTVANRLVQILDITGADAVVAVPHVSGSRVGTYTIVEPLGDPGHKPHFVVRDLLPHPQPDGVIGTLALAGRYALTPIIFDYLRDSSDVLSERVDLQRALRRLAHDREGVWATLTSEERCFDLESFLLYARAFIDFSLNDPEVGVAVKEYMEELIGADVPRREQRAR